MIIQSKIQARGLQPRSLGAIGVWSVAILCGSLVAACSGTIDTPTEEFPPREGGRSAAPDDDTPRAPTATPTPSSNNNDDDDDAPPPVASNNNPAPVGNTDDEDEPPPADDVEEPPAAGGGGLSFEADIQPIFNTTCGPCHVGAQAIAGVNIGDSDIDAALESAIDFEDRVIFRIEQGTMPPPCGGGAPGDSGCIAEDDFADVQAWYEAGAPP
jgi:hypothetical protein